MSRITKQDTLFSKRIEQIRLEKKISRVEISRIVGVSQQQIEKYEKGKSRVTIGRLYALAEALEVNLHDLIPVK